MLTQGTLLYICILVDNGVRYYISILLFQCIVDSAALMANFFILIMILNQKEIMFLVDNMLTYL